MLWVCLGDFSEILNSSEKQDRIPKSPRLKEDFRNTLLQCGLIDLGYSGNIFTWCNGWPRDAFVQERFDRQCATLDWGETFPQAMVCHLHVSFLDHDPIFLTLHGNTRNTRIRKISKRFEEKWATHPECETIIREAWRMEAPMGSPMFRACRMALVAWSRDMGNTRTHIKEKQLHLQILTAENEAANSEMIQRVRDDINALLY